MSVICVSAKKDKKGKAEQVDQCITDTDSILFFLNKFHGDVGKAEERSQKKRGKKGLTEQCTLFATHVSVVLHVLLWYSFPSCLLDACCVHHDLFVLKQMA